MDKTKSRRPVNWLACAANTSRCADEKSFQFGTEGQTDRRDEEA